LYKDQGYKLDTFQLTGEGKVYSIVQTICKIIEEFVQEFGDDVEKLNIEGTSQERSNFDYYLTPFELWRLVSFILSSPRRYAPICNFTSLES